MEIGPLSAHILVVDDDPVQRRLLKNAIERLGHTVTQAENGRAGIEALKQGHDVRVVVLDLMMPELDGLGFLDQLPDLGIEVPVIVQTGQGGIETVVQAMRAGAFDFVVKPVSPERIGTAITNALKLDSREAKAKAGRRLRTGAVTFDDIVAASPSMTRVMELGERAAHSAIPVVLEGESGVGKELVARAIQSASDRAGKPFVTVNCGAIPVNLVESILFGHEKGAFTGAAEKHIGKFMEADGGTLFLDEIGDLPLDVQVKLLRAVQQGEIETVGASRPSRVNVRLISATNKDLIEEVKAGRFREDLYYRLKVFPITIPALRKRKEDIPHMVRAFLQRISAEQKINRPLALSASAMAILTAYDWPGNIRQLENAMFRAVVLAEGNEITDSDFPQIAAQMPGYHMGTGAFDPRSLPFSADHTSDAFRPLGPRVAEPYAVSDSASVREAIASRAAENLIVSTGPAGDVKKLAEVEEELIRFALKFYRGQMSQVARKLGIGRSTLYRKLKDYGIDPDDPLKDAA